VSERPKNNAWRQVSRYASLGFLLPSCVFVGYLIGYLLDKAFGTTFLMPVFLIVGIVAGFVELIREVQKELR
jgi:F0F1-type ATP synthase assembly protein I